MKVTASSAHQVASVVIAAKCVGADLEVVVSKGAKEPSLEHAGGTVTGLQQMVQQVAAAAADQSEAAKAEINTWIEFAGGLKADADLTKLNDHLLTRSFMVGYTPTVADIYLACTLADLKVSSADSANVTRWRDLIEHQPAWTAVKGQAAAPAAGGAPGGEEEDPVKKAKREAKQAEKAAKKAKAEAKAKAAKEAAEKKAAGGGNSKKAQEAAEKAKKKEAKQAEYDAAVKAVEAIPSGTKKDVAKISALSEYHPKVVEAGWYQWWEESGFFTPQNGSKKPKYVIVIPPPNVTGTLHLGHALTNSIQDTIVRWRRMSGYECLWVPGTDHAGIATQTVVEKKIMKEEGKTRHDYGREPFLKEVWKWKEKSGGTICNQLRRLGSSLDWTRECFTMDEKLSKAVNEAFVVMHEKNLIYRDNRLVNWCCTLKTAISDIEVDYVEVEGRTTISVPGAEAPVEVGAITSFAYPLEDGSGEIVVATTRPETMLGDTAVAVHPEDPRYTSMHGKYVVHPFNGRKLPIICDAELVDMTFGTGAVKITPAHDPNDFATGKRHKLEFINIFTEDGKMNEKAAPFADMKRFTCRVKVVEALTEKGLFRGVADNAMRVPICSRSKDVIEPMIKPQWWVNCNQMAADACTAVRNKDLEILPPTFEATWYRWLENIRDWCISRQLWWGHRIPAYYVTFEGENGEYIGKMETPDRWVVGRTKEIATKIAEERFPGKNIKLEQDPDVLDTWFSSGLFPFSVMGWPEKTQDLEDFFPGALLETGHDILFFWVARMVMMSQTITGKLPFKQVYLHAMVRDAHGRKMSKSLGNVIDPIHVIEGISLEGLNATLLEGNLDKKEVAKAAAGQKADFPNGIPECGTDALRFALAAYTTQARDINLDILRVHGYRNWCNKLWNAIRFAMMNLGEGFMPTKPLPVNELPMIGKWILSKLNGAIKTTVKAMGDYDFSAATTAVYAWWQYSLCDVYIELMKPVVQGSDEAAKKGAREALWACLDTGLRLLHPFMPFVTEELWQRLPRSAAELEATPSIMLAEYPAEDANLHNPAVEAEMELLDSIMKGIRSIRAKHTIPPKQKTEAFITGASESEVQIITQGTMSICFLAATSAVHIVNEAPAGADSHEVTDTIKVHIPLQQA